MREGITLPIRQTHRAIDVGQGQANPDFKASDLIGSVAGLAPRPGCQLAELHSQHAGLARPCSENRSTEESTSCPQTQSRFVDWQI